MPDHYEHTVLTRIITVLIVCQLCACQQSPAMDRNAVDATKTTGETITMNDGRQLPLATWKPGGEICRVVLALHGFNDLHMAFDDLATELSKGCTAVYAYDQRGFGSNEDRGIWPGKEQLIADTIAATREIHARHPDLPMYLIGESMGAAIAILALTREDLPVTGGVLLAPAVWGRDVQPWYTRTALWLGMRIAPGLRLSRQWAGIKPSDDPDVLRYWDTHPLVIKNTRVDALHGVTDLMDAALTAAEQLEERVFILYGGNDEVIPANATCALLDRLPEPPAGDWRFAYYPQGYHLLTRGNGAEEVREDIAAWLRAPGDALPSGHGMSREQAVKQLCR